MDSMCFKMFLRWYRKKIAKAVEDKMYYLRTCLNEKDIILSIISPKDYKRDGVPHCNTDCLNTICISNHRHVSKKEKENV